MARKKSGLGRGLDALLSTPIAQASKAAESTEDSTSGNNNDNQLRSLPVDKIVRGAFQPRRHFDEEKLAELADSIRVQGVVQPIVVRVVKDGYELVAGERRWRAAQLAQLQDIPAVVKDIPDQAAAAISLIENIQREDLNPLEESLALQKLIEEFGLTHQQTADSVGRSRTAVSNLLRLLELEEATKLLVDQGELEMGHARALLALTGGDQIAAAKHIAARKFSVRETERYIKTLKSSDDKATKKTAKSPDVTKLENTLSDTLGASVSIQYNTKGKGKLVIDYNSLEELDGILDHIK